VSESAEGVEETTPVEVPERGDLQKALQAEREKAKSLRERVAAFEAAEAERAEAAQAAEAKRLEDEGKLRELLELRNGELETAKGANATLTEELEQFRAREAARVDALKASNEAGMAALPEGVRALVEAAAEGQDPDRVAALIAKAAGVQTPKPDHTEAAPKRVRGGGEDDSQLTPEMKQWFLDTGRASMLSANAKTLRAYYEKAARRAAK
jgi:demethoxyubiquinone hydroxylase (CLK1/Coq7/Cat5 family)